MPESDTQPPTEMQVARQVYRLLAERIPSGWSLQARQTEALAGDYRVDLLAAIAINRQARSHLLFRKRDNDEAVLVNLHASDGVPEGRAEEGRDRLSVPRRGGGVLAAPCVRPADLTSESLDHSVASYRGPPAAAAVM